MRHFLLVDSLSCLSLAIERSLQALHEELSAGKLRWEAEQRTALPIAVVERSLRTCLAHCELVREEAEPSAARLEWVAQLLHLAEKQWRSALLPPDVEAVPANRSTSDSSKVVRVDTSVEPQDQADTLSDVLNAVAARVRRPLSPPGSTRCSLRGQVDSAEGEEDVFEGNGGFERHDVSMCLDLDSEEGSAPCAFSNRCDTLLELKAVLHARSSPIPRPEDVHRVDA